MTKNERLWIKAIADDVDNKLVDFLNRLGVITVKELHGYYTESMTRLIEFRTMIEHKKYKHKVREENKSGWKTLPKSIKPTKFRN